MMTAVI
jgi:hypothetical protein